MVRIPTSVRGQILSAIAAGASRDAAARYAGFAEPELLAELAADEAFREAVMVAEARAEVASVGSIAKAAKAGDWRAGVYLLEHSIGRTPLEAGTRCGAHTKQCRECQVPWKRCPHDHETRSCRIADHLCHQAKGWGTAHPGSGHCRRHLGTTPNGEKHAQFERARDALKMLGFPVGTGDPFLLLTKTVQHAEGYLEATSQLLAESAEQAASGDALPAFAVETASELYEEAIRIAARTGKATVDADVAKRQVEIAEQTADAIVGVINAVFDELALDEAQRERGRVVAGTRLRLLAGGRAA